jgi:hypothetical protein
MTMMKWKQICVALGAAAVAAVPAWAQTSGGDDMGAGGAYGSGAGADTLGGSSSPDQSVSPSQVPSGQLDQSYGSSATGVNPTQIPGSSGSATDNTMGGGMGPGLGTGEGGANMGPGSAR